MASAERVPDRVTTMAAVLEAEPWSHDCDNPAHEWRRLFSELFGTFLLVLVGAGGGVVDAFSSGQIGRGAAAPTSTRP